MPVIIVKKGWAMILHVMRARTIKEEEVSHGVGGNDAYLDESPISSA